MIFAFIIQTEMTKLRLKTFAEDCFMKLSPFYYFMARFMGIILFKKLSRACAQHNFDIMV